MSYISPLTKLLNKREEEDNTYTNPYDDGSIWSAPDTSTSVEQSDYSNPLKVSSNSYLNPINPNKYKTDATKNDNSDYLQYARNTMDYYSKNIELSGNTVEEPKSKSVGFLGTVLSALDKITAVPRSIENLFSGAVEGIRQNTAKDTEAIMNTASGKQIESLGYITDGNKLYTLDGEEVGITQGMNDPNYAKATKLMLEAGSEARKAGTLTKTGEGAVNIGKQSVNAFINTYKASFGDTDYSEVADFSNVLNRGQNEDNYQSKIMKAQADKTPVATLLRTFGASDETARDVSNIGADIAVSMAVGNVTDLGDVGDTIKYLNKGDEIKTAEKFAKDSEKAIELARASNSMQDFTNTVENLYKAKNIEVPSAEEISKLYDNFTGEYAEKLMRKTSKTLGGMPDYEGLKIGSYLTIGRETLDKISESTVKTNLLKAGLTAYSPVSGLVNSRIANKLVDTIEGTKIGGAVKETIEDSFIGGKNNQWTKTAKANPEHALEDINMQMVASNADSIKWNNVKKYLKDADEMKKSGADLTKVTKTLEKPEETIKGYEEVTKETVNPAFVKEMKKGVEKEIENNVTGIKADEALQKELDSISKKKSAIEKKIEKAMSAENNAISSINFTKQLKKQGFKKDDIAKITAIDNIFEDSARLSTSTLTKKLREAGFKNAEDVAMRIKTSSNAVLNTFDEIKPGLASKFEGMTEIETKSLAKNSAKGNNYDIKKEPEIINKLKQDNEAWSNKLDAMELEDKVTGADKVVDGHVVKEGSHDIEKQASEGMARREGKRDRLIKDIEDYGIELDSKHKNIIEQADDETLSYYQKLIMNKKNFAETEKVFTKRNEAYNKFFKDNGIETPSSLKEGLEDIAKFRASGEATPIFKFGKDAKQVGMASKLSNIETTTDFVKATNKENIEKVIKNIMDETQQNTKNDKLKSFIQNIYDEQAFTGNSVKAKVIRELKKQGIELSTLEKATIKDFIDPFDKKDNLNDLFKLIDNKTSVNAREIAENLTDDELQLYLRTISNKNLDPITELDGIGLTAKQAQEVKDKMSKASLEMKQNQGIYNLSKMDNTISMENKTLQGVDRNAWMDDLYAKEDKPYANIDTEAGIVRRQQEWIEFNEQMDADRIKSFDEPLSIEVKKNEVINIAEKRKQEQLKKATEVAESVSKVKQVSYKELPKEALTEATDSAKDVANEIVQTTPEGKLKGYKFKLDNGSEIIVDEKITANDVRKLELDNTIANQYVYTKQSNGVSARTFYEDNDIWINVGDEKINVKGYKNLIQHENFHVIQNTVQKYATTRDQVIQVFNALEDLPDEKVDGLIKLFQTQGMDDTTSRNLLEHGFISKYVYGVFKSGASKEAIGRESNAVLGSLLTSPVKAVREQARKLFGEEAYQTFMKTWLDSKPSEMKDTVNFIRKNYSDELATKLEKLNSASDEISKRFSGASEEQIKSLKDILEDISTDTDAVDYMDRVIKRSYQFKDLAPETFDKAVGDLKFRIQFKTNIEKLSTVDLTKNLTPEEFDVYNKVRETFKHFGMEEGVDDLRANYVMHMLNPEIKMNKEAMRIARDKFGSSFDEVFNVNEISRKYEGTIEEMNEWFGKKVSSEAVDIENKKLFIDDIADIYMQRALNHENVMYKKTVQDNFLETMSKEKIINFQKLADSDDNAKLYIEHINKLYEKADGIEPKTTEELLANYKSSNKTLYQWLKTEGKEQFGLKSNIPTTDIMDCTGNVFAKRQVIKDFKILPNTLDEDLVKYKNGVAYIREDAEQVYQNKLNEINSLLARGANPKAFTDNVVLAKNAGKELVTNDTVRVQASREAQTWAKANLPKTMGKEEYFREVKEWADERRKVLREQYQNDASVYWAYNQIDVDWKKVYDGMTDKWMRDNDMIYITKKGKEEYKNFKTLGEEATEKVFDFENFSDYKVYDKNAVRNETFKTSEDKLLMIRKDRWNAWQKQVEQQAIKDKNVFLKGYDMISNIFKTQALGTPRFIANTALGNIIESYFTAGVNLMNPKMIKNYFKYTKGEEIQIGAYTTRDIAIAMEKFGVNETQVLNEVSQDALYKQLTNVGKEETTLSKFAKKVAPINPLSQDFIAYRPVRKATNEIENMSRFINVATQLERGKSLAEAIDLTNKALFDYSDLTKFEKDTMKRIIPFYTFMRNNAPLQLSNIINNPAKYGRLVDAYADSANTLRDEKGNYLTPEYMKNYLTIGQNTSLNLQLPLLGISNVLNPKELLSSTNPLIKTPMECLLNTKLYSGSQISKYGDAKDYAKYMLESVFPIFSNYGEAIGQAKEGNYEKLANIMGVPVKSFETKQAESQAIYSYIAQLEKQWYHILEENPELEEYVKQQREIANTKQTTTSYHSLSPLQRLQKKRYY